MRRRSFFRNVVAAGTILPAVLRASSGKGATRRLKIGFIGVGSRGSVPVEIPDFTRGMWKDARRAGRSL